MSRRTDRVNELLREELGELIQLHVKDPRVEGLMLSVTEVEVSPDLRRAQVYVSCLESDRARDAVAGLQSSAGYLHQELARHLRMRNIPRLIFNVDRSIERGAHLAALIDELSDADQET